MEGMEVNTEGRKGRETKGVNYEGKGGRKVTGKGKERGECTPEERREPRVRMRSGKERERRRANF